LNYGVSVRSREQPPAAIDEQALQLIHLLRGIMRRMRPPKLPERAQQAAASGLVGRRHLPVLLSLAAEGPASVRELARRIGLAPATASLLTNELNRAGLLERREDDHDRRRTIVSLPEEYRGLFEDVARRRLAPLERTLERLSPPARTQFIEGLRILGEELAREGGDDECQC
jgi:DNA-binding MarR family transcriptional regulator